MLWQPSFAVIGPIFDRSIQRDRPLSRTLIVLGSVLAIATLVLAGILWVTGISLKATDFLQYALLAGLMFALSAWCKARHDDLRLANAASILAVATLSLMLCGLIANTGLSLGMPVADAQLAAADAMLGLNMASVVRFTAANPWLSDILQFAYNWSGAAAFGAIVLFLVFGQVTRAWELATTVILAMQTVAITSMFFPAKGTAFFFDLLYLQGNGIPEGAAVYAGDTFDQFYSGAVTHVGLADINGVVVFPSFHTVLALLFTQALWNTKFRAIAVIWTATVILSTIPMGGHYAIDLAGGILVWAISYRVAIWTLASRDIGSAAQYPIKLSTSLRLR